MKLNLGRCVHPPYSARVLTVTGKHLVVKFILGNVWQWRLLRAVWPIGTRVYFFCFGPLTLVAEIPARNPAIDQARKD